MECSYIASAWPAKSNNFDSEVLPCVDGYGGVLIADKKSKSTYTSGWPVIVSCNISISWTGGS